MAIPRGVAGAVGREGWLPFKLGEYKSNFLEVVNMWEKANRIVHAHSVLSAFIFGVLFVFAVLMVARACLH